MWAKSEVRLHDALSRNEVSDADISKALHYFKVARNFHGIQRKENAGRIASLVLEQSSHLTESNAANRVTSLADAFEKHFGSRNISAASKLLWLRKRFPVVILDSQAVSGLGMSQAVARTDYPAYVRKWRDEFLEVHDEIRVAASKLSGIKEFTLLWESSNAEIKAITSTTWFHERVFDQFLWVKGSKSSPLEEEP
jgi:hypothetical protein